MNLLTITNRFPDKHSCVNFLETLRWNEQVSCTYCGSCKCTKPRKSWRWHCNQCNRSFSVLVGTPMHASKLDLRKWLLAISLIINAKKGISSRQLARDINVSKNTAWHIQMRLRQALIPENKWLNQFRSNLENSLSPIELTPIDQPKAYKRSGLPDLIIKGRGLRHYLQNIYGEEILPLQLSLPGANHRFAIDGLGGYYNLSGAKILDRPPGFSLIKPILPLFRTRFWNLLKRGIVGQYHRLTPKYTWAYLQEFSFRFRNRNNPDIFLEACKLMVCPRTATNGDMI